MDKSPEVLVSDTLLSLGKQRGQPRSHLGLWSQHALH